MNAKVKAKKAGTKTVGLNLEEALVIKISDAVRFSKNMTLAIRNAHVALNDKRIFLSEAARRGVDLKKQDVFELEFLTGKIKFFIHELDLSDSKIYHLCEALVTAGVDPKISSDDKDFVNELLADKHNRFQRHFAPVNTEEKVAPLNPLIYEIMSARAKADAENIDLVAYRDEMLQGYQQYLDSIEKEKEQTEEEQDVLPDAELAQENVVSEIYKEI
jgi:hypothetical protein